METPAEEPTPDPQKGPPEVEGAVNDPDGDRLEPRHSPEDPGFPYVGSLPPDHSQPPSSFANYPRYSPEDEGPVTPPPATVRFASIEQAWSLIRQDHGLYTLATLVMAVFGYGLLVLLEIPLLLMMVSTPEMARKAFPALPMTSQFWLSYVAVVIIGQSVLYVFGAGFFSICLKRLRGHAIKVSNIFDGFKHIGPLIIAGLVTSLIKSIATAAFLAPGFFAVGALAFVPLIIIDQKAGPFEAMALSYQALKKDVLMMGVLAMVATLLANLGAFACGIGILFTAPIYFMIIALHYHAYFPPQGEPKRVPAIPVVPQYSV